MGSFCAEPKERCTPCAKAVAFSKVVATIAPAPRSPSSLLFSSAPIFSFSSAISWWDSDTTCAVG